MRHPFRESPEFLRLIEGKGGVSLPRIALEIARDFDPSVDIDSYLRRIDALADRVRPRCSKDARPKAILAQINWVFFVEEEFRGNEADYYDPRNSLLNEVFERKTGIPISLSVLYAGIAEPLGLTLEGVDLPAHYVLRLRGAEPPLFVDPFHAGTLLDREACSGLVSKAVGQMIDLEDDQIIACPPARTVARMLRNLKAISLQTGDFAEALLVARRLAAIEPDNLEGVRDWGLLAYQTGHLGEAIGPLSRYCEVRSKALDIPTVGELLRAARREVAQSN